MALARTPSRHNAPRRVPQVCVSCDHQEMEGNLLSMHARCESRYAPSAPMTPSSAGDPNGVPDRHTSDEQAFRRAHGCTDAGSDHGDDAAAAPAPDRALPVRGRYV
jgi:hypothetical protein